MPDQVFPPEIEHIIFTDACALKELGESALNLALVARRVHIWLTPKLMETLAIRTIRPAQKYPGSWDITTLSKYGIHTRNLFLWISSPHFDSLAEQYSSLCPNITNLVIWLAYPSLPIPQLEQIANLQALTHLSLNLNRVPSSAWDNPKLLRVFNRITHLHNVATISSQWDMALFKHFTSITHVTFQYPSEKRLVPLLLTKLPASLEVLVILEGNYTHIDHISIYKSSLDDPRVVNIVCQADKELDEWLLDVQKGQGIWGLADQVVRERKKVQQGLYL
ncbi:hypothetical protein BDN72DRAFT_847833 [Pluteus cervinus]|uniref:Uncharacterized protein n=1 Tax=Pluteus cervinus TaxID=181527 RepID=A0ACD3ABV7_9AGAR|nr:hypothetical protein BDN72DRAFT_847833 [Pluteus cervinus]